MFFLLWQMGKQTMGFPVHALDRRADNKLYKLQTPQSPVVRPVMYDHYEMDTYPLGTNAIVAVMSYTVSTTVWYWSCSTCIWSYCTCRMYLYTVNQQNLNMLVRFEHACQKTLLCSSRCKITFSWFVMYADLKFLSQDSVFIYFN